MSRTNRYLIAVPFALLLAACLPVLWDLVIDWNTDANYSHGFLVPVVSAVLLWRKRHELRSLPMSTDRRGLVVVALSAAMFIVGNGAAEYFTVRVSFVLTLFGLTWYLFGPDIIKRAWFAFFFLLFMIPIPYVIYYALTFPMQTFASKVTVQVLGAIGMGAVRQGNMIHIAGHSLEVAEACSGIRSLVSLLALGALFAYATQKRFAAQGILFLSTIPIAVIGNVFRVFVTSLLVYTVSEAVAEEPLHSLMGLSVFAVAFVMLGIESAILRRIFK
ncbi:MAG TPA: exosortase/archaeosortase family protein [Candidatus Deferrimicrobium sp.]|nr:exosortase/archaeosortase family protein [Candidatus Deferrimicrobium sp.]